MAQQVKNLPAVQETQEMPVLSLSLEDPLEEEMATHPNILTWKIPWTKEPGRLQSMGLQRVRHNWAHGTHQGPKNKNKEDADALNINFLKDCANFKASPPLPTPPSIPMLR